MQGPGLLPEVQEGREWNSGMRMWQGQGPGWRKEVTTRDLSKASLGKKWSVEGGWDVEEVTGKMDLERRGRIDWGREEAHVCGRSAGGSKCKGERGLLGNTWEPCL